MDNHAEGKASRTVYFDDECELCEGAVKKIQADIDLNTVGMSADLPRFIDREALKREVHAMDENGVMHTGIDAIIVILRWHPQGKYLAPVLALPGIKQVGAVVYRIVASNRHRWFGKKM